MERLAYVEGPAGAAAIARAAALLREGRLVAFPTETVYGLGADARSAAAVARIFAAKGRPPTHPLIVHVPSLEAAAAVAELHDPRIARLAAAFWPGPLTLVLPRLASVPPEVSAGLPSVGVRVPAHPVALALLRAVDRPIAAPSANLYTTVSPTSARHVERSLGGRIDALLDGGETPIGIESTVLSLAEGAARLLRPGAIGQAELEAVIGPIERGPGVVREGAHASPGLSAKHYAPRATVRLVGAEALVETVEALPAGARVVVVARRARPAALQVEAWLQLPETPAAYARQLYAALHAVEEAGATHAVLEAVPAGAGWEAVADRLGRAAG